MFEHDDDDDDQFVLAVTLKGQHGNINLEAIRDRARVDPDKLLTSDPKCGIQNRAWKYFMSHSSLKVHQHLHVAKKSYTCSVCCKSFRQKWSLEAHMCMHTGKKPFLCTVWQGILQARTSQDAHHHPHG
ncbi:gastrula zinc finger protein XlCGF16.1-like isoform X2 [Thalassophryne amazonica]|uniref:gastrula zinc finger protein XlCGF16.1-like isoform X2 n=1 Tax=Thalassophryne amazonica TaxID=390379 RepID=UPI001471CA77|nr:gastrula zinc finger protein XlCGF16.1-like isoform X2 [Thalassophryne amazonica]